MPRPTKEERGTVSVRASRDVLRSGRQRPSTGLWPRLGSEQRGAAAACGGAGKGRGADRPFQQLVQLRDFWHCRNDSNGVNPREELDLGGYCPESNLSSCHGLEVQLLSPPIALFIEEYDKNACKHLNILNCFSLVQHSPCLHSVLFWGHRHTEFMTVVLLHWADSSQPNHKAGQRKNWIFKPMTHLYQNCNFIILMYHLTYMYTLECL